MHRSEQNAERRRRKRRISRSQRVSIIGASIFAGFFCSMLDGSLASLGPGYHLLVTPAFAGHRRDRGGNDDSGRQGDQGQDLGRDNSDSRSHGDGNDGNSGGNSNADSRGDSNDAQSGGSQSYSNGASSGDDDGRAANGSERARGNRRGQSSADDESKPPRTVEQLLKRIFAPASASSKHAIEVPPPAMLPEIRSPAVIGLNVSPLAIEKAKAKGFKAAPPTSLASLAYSVTQLVPPDGMSITEAQQLLAEELPMESFGINQKYHIYRTATGTPENPKASTAAQIGGNGGCKSDHCFGRDLIGWKPEVGRCASGIRIGIIDTSVDVQHPTFSRKKFELGRFSASARGLDWHGTGVTALLAGDSASGTPGLIPDADFVVADIFHADTDGQPASDTMSMLRALDWLEAKKVKIINMSLSGPYDELVRRAIDKLSANGVLFVAAAGNDGPSAGPSYPAAYDHVIAVTAVGKNLKGYRYANRGNYIDIAAPGVSIWTALPGSMEGYRSGTSFAVPYVTAALAAIYNGQSNSSKFEILKQLAFKDLGEPGRDPVYGEGLLIAPTTCGPLQIARSAQGPTGSITAGLNPVGSLGAERLPWHAPRTDN